MIYEKPIGKGVEERSLFFFQGTIPVTSGETQEGPFI
jgi:hypothetical protein